MNIIEAWNKARVGELISRDAYPNVSIKKRLTDRFSTDFIAAVTHDSTNPGNIMFDRHILADDWEVKRRPLVWEGEISWHSTILEGGLRIVSPWSNPVIDANRVIRDMFEGKRTRVHIEEIVE